MDLYVYNIYVSKHVFGFYNKISVFVMCLNVYYTQIFTILYKMYMFLVYGK